MRLLIWAGLKDWYVSQLSYGRNVKVEDCVKVGDEVEVKILSLDWGGEGRREKISLSIKVALGDPWERIRMN